MSQYLCLFSLILQGLHKEGECQKLGFRAGKGANIGDLFCTSPKVMNFTEVIFGINKKYWRKNPPEGAHTLATRVGARPTPLGAPPASWATWQPSGAHLLLYEVFHPRKNHKQAFGTRLCCHEAEPWRNQSRALAELFCRGNFPPGWGNHHHRHHQRSSHREGVNLHQHLHQHHLISNPSSSLVSNLCIQTSDWYL